MITPGTVGVGEPPAPQQTKQIDNVALAQPDTTAVRRQVVALGDPEAWGNIAPVATSTPAAGAAGLVVRPVPAAPSYDSTLQAIPDSATAVTAVDTQVGKVLLSNQTTQQQWVTLTDGGGGAYLNEYPLDPKQLVVLDFGGATLAGGVTWQASLASAVNGQIVGNQ